MERNFTDITRTFEGQGVDMAGAKVFMSGEMALISNRNVFIRKNMDFAERVMERAEREDITFTEASSRENADENERAFKTWKRWREVHDSDFYHEIFDAMNDAEAIANGMDWSQRLEAQMILSKIIPMAFEKLVPEQRRGFIENYLAGAVARKAIPDAEDSMFCMAVMDVVKLLEAA